MPVFVFLGRLIKYQQEEAMHRQSLFCLLLLLQDFNSISYSLTCSAIVFRGTSLILRQDDTFSDNIWKACARKSFTIIEKNLEMCCTFRCL